MVFISHDTRDADIAEAFSNLLKSVSAGILKSFRSSDKKGKQGIEYGTGWYPTIMSKIDNATDVVCLLTPNSLDRPWILYEAGVAKGKLGITVLGIAIGVELGAATNGPFAQFQNCDDDENSLSKLVAQLVERMPGAEPDLDIIKTQVLVFKAKVAELLVNQPATEHQEDATEEADKNNPAKLFEEIKVMFNDIPQRIEKSLSLAMAGRPRYDGSRSATIDILDLTKYGSPEMTITVALAVLRNSFPWVYDLGHLVLTTIKTKRNQQDKEEMVRFFLTVLKKSGYYFERQDRPNSSSYQRAFDIIEQAMHDLLLGRI